MCQSGLPENLGEPIGSEDSPVITPLKIEYVRLTIVNFYLSFVEQMALWEAQLTIELKYLWSRLPLATRQTVISVFY